MGDPLEAVALSHRQVRDGLPAESLGFRGRPLDEGTRRLLEVVAQADALASGAGYGDGYYEAGELSEEQQAQLPHVTESIRLELAHAGALLDLEPCDPADMLRVLTNAEMRASEEMSTAIDVGDDRPDLLELAGLHSRLLGRRSMGVVNELLECGLRDIREGLDLDRVMLFEKDPDDSGHVRGRVVLDGSEIVYPRGVHGLQLPSARRSPLTTALEQRVAVVGGAGDGHGPLTGELGIESFIAAPLSAGNATFGVVVADRFFSSRPVEAADAATLGLLCDTLGLVLENMALDCQGKTLRSLAEKDELTGINNRRNIVSLLEAEIRRSRRFGTPLSVALLDIDFFKKWNDVHGHQVGDQVLKAVAQIIASCSREVDHYGRYGGEEFLVVLPETPTQHAVLYAERLRVTLQSHGEESLTQYAPTTLTMSIGLTSLDPRGDDVDRLVQRADSALYAAKKHGRNRVCVEAPSRGDA
jgi:diguanylate cyclase (GGDEF)-like protein